MSTSDLYVINGKSTRHFAEFRNGWGSAPIAWDHLARKYLGGVPSFSLSEDRYLQVWDLASGTRIKPYEKVVLMMTFDRAYVPIPHLNEAGKACERFGAECGDGGHANHWQAIGLALREAATKKLGRHARGLCLSCTSVSNAWGWPTAHQLEHAWPIFEDGPPAPKGLSDLPDQAAAPQPVKINSDPKTQP